LALDEDNHPHISYFDPGPYTLKYAFYTDTWQIATVDQAFWGETTLALDNLPHGTGTGRPHVSYYGRNRLRHAYLSGTLWISETIDRAGNVGRSSSLAMDAAGYAHISYEDETNGDLKYARPCIHLDAALIDGPDSLPMGTDGIYAAAYSPLSASHPLTFTWSIGSAGYYAIYGWPDPGWHTITLTATNPCTRISHTVAVSVYCQPVESAQVVGPSSLPAGQEVTYQASAVPVDSSPPISWIWDTGHSFSPTAIYSWTAPGTYRQTVTATNPCGQGSGAFTVNVFCQPVQGISLTGPLSLPTGHPGLYQATAEPITASPPITFTWSNNTMGASTAYTWSTPGIYTLTVTATNDCGQAQEHLSVTIFCQPISHVGIVGPLFLLPAYTGTYTSFAQPFTTSPPITFTWSSGTTGPTATYSWPSTGTYTIRVSGTNDCGYGTGSLIVQVVERLPYSTYLPFVSKHYQRGFCLPVEAPGFAWVPVAPTVGEEIHFVGEARGSLPITFTWDFGDGKDKMGAHVTHQYTTTGTYRVIMTATNCGPAPITASHTITIVPCEPARDAAFSWEPLTPTVDQVVTFTGWASGSLPITFTWDFGDRLTAVGPGGSHRDQRSSRWMILATGSYTDLITHTYAISGTYTVAMTAANSCSTLVVSREIWVKAAE
jgi:PKD repeat protein